MGIHFDGSARVTVAGVGAVVGSEFAEIAVSIDEQANSPRLKLEDLRTGRVRFLDALELETVIWLPDERLNSLLDPSADRWRGDE
ncbi:hypothetical protein SBI67_23390 [Mycolicibacterium sp. 120266]|uniref:hypothetical protein n=1 Tax=Mycolicibacterium sp. 120266 TaxID=3090601 RepID=UPI00299ECEE7|nr:hypothetical protein [Mycolicibacterium sp. 120266]MDX1875072.1 hypothetical protein [Mycolicibacterium sp. 120266]